ncbi:MAG: type VI secretion system contractile sheath large subunit [Acidobacteriota bacterium]|jgi:type VI secretion system protein ImpC
MESPLEKLQSMAAGHPQSLPQKLLVIADCIGRDGGEPVRVTASGAEGLLESLRPTLKLLVANKLQIGSPKISLDLEIQRLADFEPESLLSHSEALAAAAANGRPALGEQLDEILHHPEFQRMEACWLGLDRLCKAVAGKEGVLLEVLPATRKTLKESFHQKVFEPEYQGTAEVPLSAAYFDYRFSHEPADLPLLEALAGDCAALQVPMIAPVAPAFFQLKNLAHLPNLPDVAAMLQSPAYANWRRFQTDPMARWVCLTANRYLARETYSLSKASGASVDYVEKADAAHPDSYLWAEAGWLVLANLGRSFAAYRHCVVIDGMSLEAAHTNLPVRPFPKKANVMVPSPTEILIDDNKAWEIVRGGITMLVGISDGAVATFPLLANVYRRRTGVLTTESALSYQMIAGHLSHYLVGIYGKIPIDQGPQAIDAFLKEKLYEFLIPFVGEKPEDNVRTEIVEVAGDPPKRMLNLTLKPLLKLQSKDVEFTLQLAL